MRKKFRIVSLLFVVMFTLGLSACGAGSDGNDNSEIGQKKLTMPYVSWASAVAGVNVMK